MDTAFIAALLGVGGALAGAIVGSQATRSTNRATLIADLYSRAIDQLGSDKLDVRIGGIYALERVARDSKRDHPTVIEVLAAFIREHSHEQWPPAESGSPAESANAGEPKRATRPDVQAALTVIGRRQAECDIRPIDLSGAELADAKVPRGTGLTRAKLTHVDLTCVDLTDQNLDGADLTGAKLTHVDLIRAVLRPVPLTAAERADAKVSPHAPPDAAKLKDATLTDVDLTGADLTGADLTHADLAGAKGLDDAILTDTILTNAKWPEDASVPEGWKLNSGSGRLVARH